MEELIIKMIADTFSVNRLIVLTLPHYQTIGCKEQHTGNFSILTKCLVCSDGDIRIRSNESIP